MDCFGKCWGMPWCWSSHLWTLVLSILTLNMMLSRCQSLLLPRVKSQRRSTNWTIAELKCLILQSPIYGLHRQSVEHFTTQRQGLIDLSAYLAVPLQCWFWIQLKRHKKGVLSDSASQLATLFFSFEIWNVFTAPSVTMLGMTPRILGISLETLGRTPTSAQWSAWS